MYALRLFVLAALALLCSAFTTGAAQPCIADYGNARGGFQPCSPVSVSWVKELARNCTDGDLSRAYTALAKLCDDTRKENAGLEHAIMDRNLDNVPTDHDSRIIVRRPSSDAATSAAESKVQSRQWQSSSSSSKRYSWLWKDPGVDGFFLGSIFAERSVRFALSGLLLTTLTSFIFL